MTTRLRPIALTVDEPSPGLFQWALVERGALPHVYDHPVIAADAPYDSFEKAARAGLIQWTRLAGDTPRQGPRLSESQPLEPARSPWSGDTRNTRNTSPA